VRGVPDYLLAEYIKKALCALSRTSQLKQKLQKMKLILVLLVVATASASSQADFYGGIPSLQGILCQLHLGDIPLCPASSCKEIADTRPGDSRSGLHWLTNGDTVFQARCDHGIPPSQSRGWMQVANITSDSGCPAGLEQLTAGGRKLCRKTVDTGYLPKESVKKSPKAKMKLLLLNFNRHRDNASWWPMLVVVG
jgi:hypothetical protein